MQARVPARVATGATRHRELDRDASFRLHARRELPDRTTPVSSLPAPEEELIERRGAASLSW
jgi:hypothetical protein